MIEDEDEDEDERLALPRLLRARTDRRQFKGRRFARGRAAASSPRRRPMEGRRVQGSGFRVQIIVAIFVDNDRDKDRDNAGRSTMMRPGAWQF
jgi:hypothetical protein